MKKPTCTFLYGGPAIQSARRFFHSYLKETKKINNQFLNETKHSTNRCPGKCMNVNKN